MGEEAEKKAEEQQPLVIQVDLHCGGCVKKIHRCITKIRGVQGVSVDKEKNQVTIKGAVDHQAVCSVIAEKTKRKVTVISPVLQAEGQPVPEVVNSQVDASNTVELKVNMHCEACAEQLKQKILKLKGVRTAITEFSSGKVVVTGTMDAGKLVEYVYRRTKKQAQIVPAPEPEPEKKEPEAPPAEEPKPEPPAEEKKEEPPAEEKKEEPPAEEKKEEPPAEEKKEEPPAEEKKEEPPAEEKKEEKESKIEEMNLNEEEILKKMIYYYHPLYVFETIPPPQMFSDENPNACCIS